MAFNVENASGAALSIDDLGITLETSEIIDLSVQGSFDTIVGSIQVGEEVSQLIQAGDLIVKDPNDGVTNLSIADGIACARALGDPNYRVGAGAILGDISDIVLSTPSNTEVLTYDSGSGTWINAAGGSGSGGFSGLGIWRYRTATTSTPASGQLQFDNITIDSATELYVSVLNDAGTDMSAFLSLITSGSLLYLQLQGDSTQFVVAEVGTSSLLSGVYTFPLTNVEAQGTAPSNNAQIALVVAGSGSGGGGGDPDQNLWETITSDAGSTTANITTDTLTIAGGTGISTAVSGDTLTITNDSPNVDQDIWETISSDAGSTTANTTTDTLTIAGGTGISTAIAGDTLTITATGTPDQNLWETITSDSGSAVANIPTDTLTIAGGTGISTAVSGDTLTVTNDSPNVDQNLWETITSDAGSAVANTTTDTLTIAGGTGISTAISGDTLTITATSGTDELVKISANDTTAGFLGVKVVGVTDETAITELNDGGDEDLEVGLADDVILPGTGSATLPSGTLLERPGTPAAGMIRFNDTTSFMEYYNGTEWITLVGNSIGPGTLTGSIVGYHFLLDKFEYGVWLGTTTKHITSDEVQYVMPFGAEIVAITYGADKTSDIDLAIEVAGPTAGNTNATLFTWSVTDSRVARISTPTGSGGPGGIALPAGSKLGIFASDPGGGTEPADVVVSVYIQWTDEAEEEDSEDYAGDFT